MDKLKILMMLLICLSFVSATSVEKGHITSNEILIPEGVLLISPSSITQTINSGDTINSQIIMNLSSEKEFEVTFSSDLNVNFETRTMTISDGKNILNFSATASLTSSGFIFMDYGNQSYKLAEINLHINSQNSNNNGGSSSSGGSSRRYYLCGNGVCDSGETATTCASDCIEYEELDFMEGGVEEEIPEETIDESSLGKITGAVIGTVTSKGGIITIIALAVLIGGFFALRKVRKKNIKNFK